jgi:hypothetical protein
MRALKLVSANEKLAPNFYFSSPQKGRKGREVDERAHLKRAKQGVAQVA